MNIFLLRLNGIWTLKVSFTFSVALLIEITLKDLNVTTLRREAGDFVARVVSAFPRQRENVHALGAKCKKRWHARSWCFPARKEVSSNEPGSNENGSTLRYIVACTRDRDVMLYEDDVNISTPVFVDQFKRWIDYLDD